MIDYDVGDEIVYIKNGCTGSTLIKNKIYICHAIDGNTDLGARCIECNSSKAKGDLIVVEVREHLGSVTCSCCYRKKLDFKKLCNVNETIKIKENA